MAGIASTTTTDPSTPDTDTDTATSTEPTSTTATDSATTATTATSTNPYLLGPLTTTFTAPTRCSQAYWVSASDDIYDPTLGQSCTSYDSSIYYTQDNGCLPPVTQTTIVGSLTDSSTVLATSSNYYGYYSPGIACPTGYTTACAAQVGANGIQSALSNYQSFDFIFSATASETVLGCCPTGYQCANYDSEEQWCQQIIASTTLPVITCANVTNSVSTATTRFTLPTVSVLSESETYSSSTTVITSTFSVTTLSVLASMIQLNYQATDVTSTSSSSLSSTSSTSSTPSATTSSTSSGGGSSHKTTAIAVGVVVPCVALIAAAFAWFWYRRRTSKRLSASYQAAQTGEPSDMYQSTGTASTLYNRASTAPTEISADPAARYEVAGSVPQYEMAGTDPSTVAHEMYAGHEGPPYHDDETAK